VSVLSHEQATVAAGTGLLRLREAIAATARTQPARPALSGAGGTVTYGELLAALPAAVAPARERRVLVAKGTTGDVVELLACACAGHSVLVLDGSGTAWERERTSVLFHADPAPAVPVVGLCTSGTNGLPRVVELDFDSAIANAATFAGAIGYGPRDTIWLTTPLAHLYGLFAGAIAGLLSGARTHVSSGALGPGEFADLLLDEAVTVLLTVPFLARRFLEELARRPDVVRAAKLRATLAAGEAVPEELIAGWRAATATPLLAHYGLTEGGHITLASGEPGEGVGSPLPDVEVRIADNGVLVRRRAPARPYHVIGEAPLDDGWRVTGDIGHVDAAGNLHITGRAGDRINVAGKKVDPAEVENALRACELVADCAVAGVRRADGEQVVAFVTGAADIADGQLRAELARTLSSYKLPRRFVRVEAIPRTLTGKVRRGQLVATLEMHTPKSTEVGPQ
jgi:acyl-coenzyme A synthetase/AMP-(fatty) acid ligase